MKHGLQKSMLTGGLLLALSAWGGEVDGTAQALLKQLRQQMPAGTHVEVAPSPLPGLYQITLDGQVIYMSADGRYVINGTLRDLKSNRNLTEEAQRKARLALLKPYPKDRMITYPAKGTQKREMWVFDDIHCPYCRKLHRILPKLQAAGITVHVLFFPRAGLNSRSYLDAVHVWCSDKRRETLDAAMQGKPVPATKGSCRNPVAEHLSLAGKIGVSGTPYMVLDNGEAVPGYVPPEKLIPYLVGRDTTTP